MTPHPLFERREDDLHVEVPIGVWEAALGAEVEVPTLRGKVSMKIPPETSSGRTFRLPGYGLPHLKGGGRGDQFVRVRIAMPRASRPRSAPSSSSSGASAPRLRASPPETSGMAGGAWLATAPSARPGCPLADGFLTVSGRLLDSSLIPRDARRGIIC